MKLPPYALQALAWLLTYALHSSVLLLGAWLVTARLVRRERVRELVWKVALVGGIATASVQCFLAFEPHTGKFALEQEAPLVAGPATSAPAERLPEAVLLELVREANPGQVLGELPPARTLPPERPRTAERIDWKRGLLALWIAGGTVLLLLFALAGARLRDHLAGRRRLRDGPLVLELERLRAQAGLRRPVRLMLSPKLRAPIALGTLLPEICLPPRALSELDADQQRAMLAHELAHIARFDPGWLTLCRWIETLFFFQPLNRVARRGLDRAAEILSDGQALRWTGDPLGLARCLATVAEWILGERRRFVACGMADHPARLTERVTQILEREPEPESAPAWVAPMGGIALALTVLLAPGFSIPAAAADEPLGRIERVAAPLLESAPSEPTPTAVSAPSLEDGLRAMQAELAQALVQVETELEGLRAEMAASASVPSGLSERWQAVERRLEGLRTKKSRMDELLARWLAHTPANTTIDAMDRSHQGGRN